MEPCRRRADDPRGSARTFAVLIGIDTYDGRGLSSPEDLRRRANMALKEAKKRGKNRIWLYSGPDAVPPDASSSSGTSPSPGLDPGQEATADSD